ncbi:MAG: hypothetical protein N3E40_07580 [Dehalococcoidia bacterium]|nr:hypothetical protein [Dehalococcoidia bacterium]
MAVGARGPNPGRTKMPEAQVLGKLGGIKGGPARAQALPPAKRTQIARHAARIRWKKPSHYTKPAFYRRKVK